MTYSVPGLVRTHLVSSSYMGTVDSPFVRTRAVIDQMKGWGDHESRDKRNGVST